MEDSLAVEDVLFFIHRVVDKPFSTIPLASTRVPSNLSKFLSFIIYDQTEKRVHPH